MRLIDADALLLRLGSMIKEITPIEYSREMFYHDTVRNGALVGARVEVQNAPTIDAVPVVRCKDCKYGHPTIDGSWMCSEATNREWVSEEHFCSYGERKE